MTDITFYGHKLPKLNTLVNFKAIKRKDGFFECFLTDYNLECSMPFNYTTQRKRVKSWNKLVPLNKEMIGYTEEVEENNIIISIAYIDEEEEVYKKFLVEKSENNKLKSIFTKYSFSNNLNLKELWGKYIYPLDLKRVNKSKLTLYNYVIKNSNKFNDKLLEYFTKEINDFNSINYLIETNIGLISFDGVSTIQKIINETMDELELKLKIIVQNVPNYKIISNDKIITKDDHNNFIKLLNTKIKDKNIFLNI